MARRARPASRCTTRRSSCGSRATRSSTDRDRDRGRDPDRDRAARLYSAVSSLHTFYAFRLRCPSAAECPSSPEVHDEPRGGPGCRSSRLDRSPGRRVRCAPPRNGASRPEGPRSYRVRRALHLSVAAARLPDRARSRSRIGHRGHRREPVPGLLRRDRGERDRALSPPGRGGDPGASDAAPALQRLGLLPAHLRAARGRAGRIAPIHGPSRVFLGNSGTEVVEAAIKLARYSTGRPYVVSFLGGFHGRTYGSVSLSGFQGEVPRPFRPPAAGCPPRAIRGRRASTSSSSASSNESCRQARSRRSSSSRSRARAASRSRTTSSCRDCAGYAISTGSCSWQTRCRAAWAGPGGCGPSSTGASSRTSS